MAENFYVDPKPQRMAVQPEGEELQPAEPEEPQEPADSDIDDEALAKHLGVPKSSMAASDGAEGSQESLTASVAEGSQDLHTGIAACAAEGSQDLHTGITASGAEGSPELHTGITDEFKDLSLQDKQESPKPVSIKEPQKTEVLVLSDSPPKKNQKFEQDAPKLARIEELRQGLYKA